MLKLFVTLYASDKHIAKHYFSVGAAIYGISSHYLQLSKDNETLLAENRGESHPG